jgi:murein L,D-transpeptidase YcbB/YkuD
VIALIVVAALAFGIITWVGHIRGNQSSAPIEGVSETLYEQGIALVKSHVDAEYINGMITKYTTDGVLSMSASLEEGKAAINALLPAEPAVNDQMFIDALQAIQDNIVSAITMDALSVSSGSETAVADSEGRWQIVNASIQQLEAATSAAELTAVINGQVITVQTQTPEPTVEPVTYANLQKGDESNDVMKLQVRLYNLGYLNDDRDGVYGSKTQTAVKMFQETMGLPATGIADSATQAAIYAEDAPVAPGATTPQPAPTVQPTPEPTSEAIQPAEANAPAGDNAA